MRWKIVSQISLEHIHSMLISKAVSLLFESDSILNFFSQMASEFSTHWNIFNSLPTNSSPDF